MLIIVEPLGGPDNVFFLFLFIYLFCNMLTVSISRFGELNTDQYSVVTLFNFVCPTLEPIVSSFKKSRSSLQMYFTSDTTAKLEVQFLFIKICYKFGYSCLQHFINAYNLFSVVFSQTAYAWDIDK